VPLTGRDEIRRPRQRCRSG